MRYITLLILLITKPAFSCTYADWLNFNIGELAEKITPKDCTSSKFRSKRKICECANENLEKGSFIPDDRGLKAIQEKSIEKAKIGLLNLSDEIFMLHNVGGPVGDIKLGAQCNAKKKLGDNSTAQNCPGKKDLVLDKANRKEILDNLYSQLKIDSSVNGPRLFPPKKKDNSSLFDRYEFNSNANNECSTENPFTQKLATDINFNLQKARIGFYSQLNGLANSNSQNFYEFLFEKEYTSNFASEQQGKVTLIKDEIMSNPYFIHLMESPEVFQDIKANIGNSEKIFEIIEKAKESSNITDNIKSRIEQKCDIVFEAIEEAICAEVSDLMIPEFPSKSKVKKFAKNMGSNEKYDKNNVAHILQSSHNLDSLFCKKEEGTEDNFSKIDVLVNQALPPSLQKITDFDTAAQVSYNTSTLNIAEKLCPLLPPDMAKLNEAVTNCKKGTQLPDQDCVLVNAANAAIEKTYKTKAIQVKNETIAKAKKDGVTDQAQIDKLVQSAIKNIDTNAIMEAYSDFSNVGKKNSDLINSFLGVVEPKTTAPTIAEKKDVIPPGASTKLTPAELAIGGFSVNSSDSDLKATSYSELAQKSQEKEINNFYDEVARRVKGFRQRQASSPISTSVGSTGQKPIPKELQRALKSPFPEPAPVKDDEEDDYYELASNYGLDSDFDYSPGNTTNNNFFENSDISRTPVVADKPAQTEQDKKALEYNRALRDANKARQEEAALAAARASGKIPDSPFKNRELGAAGGTQFRAPASLGGGGGLSFSPEYLPLNPDTLEQDFKDLIENVAAEKQKGIEGENTEHAKMILKMLSTENGKTVYLRSTLNPEHEIQIMKKRNGKLEVKGRVNGADDAFVRFVKKVDEVIIGYNDNSYKSQFSKILSDLEYAMKEGRVKPVLSGEETRVTDFK